MGHIPRGEFRLRLFLSPSLPTLPSLHYHDDLQLLYLSSICHFVSLNGCIVIHGVLISPYPDPTEKTIERLLFYVRHGGHCCCGHLVGQKTF